MRWSTIKDSSSGGDEARALTQCRNGGPSSRLLLVQSSTIAGLLVHYLILPLSVKRRVAVSTEAITTLGASAEIGCLNGTMANRCTNDPAAAEILHGSKMNSS